MTDTSTNQPEEQKQAQQESTMMAPMTASQTGTVLNTLTQLRESRRYEPQEAKDAEPLEIEEGTGEQPKVNTTEGGVQTEGTPIQVSEPETPKFKYRSQEEAEKAYREAERRMHQATTEKAALQKELEELKARLAALEQEKEKKSPSPPPNQDEIVQRLIDINNRIDDLDPFDPDYPQAKAKLEVEKALMLDAYRGAQSLPSPDKIGELVRQELQAREQELAKQRELEDLANRVNRLATSFGLDMQPGSWDYKIFWRAVRAGDVPDGDLETQVKTLAQEILADKARFGQQAVQDMHKIHDDNAVLGRGGIGPHGSGGESFRPASIHEIIMSNRRRI